MQEPKMCLALNVDGPKVVGTPMIGNIQFHVQSYVVQEEIFISTLKNQDFFWACESSTKWFPRLSLKIVISFKHRGREVILHVNYKGHTIPIISKESFKKSIR